MAREKFGIEKGYAIYAENGDSSVFEHLVGTAAPTGTGDQASAPIGSLYSRTGTGELYKKETNTIQASDWVLVGNAQIDELSWRNERVVAATGDTLVAGNLDPTTLTDNEQGLSHTAFSVGDFILGDCDGVPALFEVTALPGAPNITIAAASQPIADNDTFMVQNYLPDSPASQEGQAIIHIPLAGAPCVKVGDVNWDFATGINLSSGYAQTNGTVTSADNVETAIEKLDGNQIDLTTLSGMPQGSVDNGTFTGSTIPDASTTKEALQALETAVESAGSDLQFQSPGVTAAVTLDSVVVDDVLACEWEVHAREDANPARVKVLKVLALHDGHSGADASNVDDTQFAKLKIGNFNTQISVDLDGTGAGQTMRLRVASSTAGVTFSARRTDITG